MPVIIYTPTPSSAPPSAPASAATTQHQGLADYPARPGLLKLATAQPKLKRKGKGKEEKKKKRAEEKSWRDNTENQIHDARISTHSNFSVFFHIPRRINVIRKNAKLHDHAFMHAPYTQNHVQGDKCSARPTHPLIICDRNPGASCTPSNSACSTAHGGNRHRCQRGRRTAGKSQP